MIARHLIIRYSFGFRHSDFVIDYGWWPVVARRRDGNWRVVTD